MSFAFIGARAIKVVPGTDCAGLQNQNGLDAQHFGGCRDGQGNAEPLDNLGFQRFAANKLTDPGLDTVQAARNQNTASNCESTLANRSRRSPRTWSSSMDRRCSAWTAGGGSADEHCPRNDRLQPRRCRQQSFPIRRDQLQISYGLRHSLPKNDSAAGTGRRRSGRKHAGFWPSPRQFSAACRSSFQSFNFPREIASSMAASVNR